MDPIEFKKPNGDVYCTLLYKQEEDCFYILWSGAFGLQDNILKVVECIKESEEKYRFKKMLSDCSSMKGAFDTAMKSIARDIEEGSFKSQVAYHALIMPTEIFSKLTFNDFSKKDFNQEMKFFDNIEAAKAWLQSIP